MKMANWLLTLLLIVIIRKQLASVIYDHIPKQNSEKSLLAPLRKLFIHNAIIFVESEETNDLVYDVMKTLEQIDKYSLELRECGNGDNCSEVTDNQIVLYTKTSNQLQLVLENCLCFQWLSSSKILIFTNSADEVESMLNVLQELYIFKALILVLLNDDYVLYAPEHKCTIDINGRDDSTFQNCNGFYNYTLDSSICNLTVGLKLIDPYTMKSEIKSNVLSNYRSDMTYRGIEIMIAQEIIDVFNIVELKDDQNPSEENVTDKANCLLEDLKHSNIDIAMGALSFNVNSPFIASSYPVLYEKMVAVVKKRIQKPYLDIFGVFTFEMWLFLFIVNIVYVYTIWTVMINIDDMNLPVSSINLHVLSMSIGQVIPIKKSLRMIYISGIWYMFVLRLYFRALLVYSLFDSDGIQVNTLETLCDDSYVIFVSSDDYTRFHNGFELSNCFISNKNFIISNDSLKALLNYENDSVAAFMYERYFYYTLPRFVDVAGNIPFHMVKEHISTTPLSYYFRRCDPLLDIIEQRVIWLYEAGIIGFYETVAKYIMKIRMTQNILKFDLSYDLSLNQLSMIFYTYILGVILSIAVFICELFAQTFCKFSGDI